MAVLNLGQKPNALNILKCCRVVKISEKCNLTLAMSPHCNNICPMPLPSHLLYIIVISHLDGSNSMVLSSHVVLPVHVLVPGISQQWR